MTKLQFSTTLVFIIFIQSTVIAEVCRGEVKNAEMVVKCFRNLYFNNYDKLWDYLNKENERLAIPGDRESISKFLIVVNVGGGNAEYSEYIHDFIENSIIKNTEEFMGSLLLLDKKTLGNVFNILERPIYASSQEVIDVLEKYVDLVEYKDIQKNMKNTKDILKIEADKLKKLREEYYKRDSWQ